MSTYYFFIFYDSPGNHAMLFTAILNNGVAYLIMISDKKRSILLLSNYSNFTLKKLFL